MSDLKGKVAIVTGATSQTGSLLPRQLPETTFCGFEIIGCRATKRPLNEQMATQEDRVIISRGWARGNELCLVSGTPT